MARPKKLKSPSRLNLLINGKAKRKASKMAFDRRISIGQLFETLIEAEEQKSAIA